MSRISLTDNDIEMINRVVATEAAHHLARSNPKAYQAQVHGIVDTILNRVASPQFPNTVRAVANQKKHFSAINGPRNRKYTVYGSVDKVPASRASKQLRGIVGSHIKARKSGTPSSVGGNLHYANPYHSDRKNLGWINGLKGPKLGVGRSIHYHGTAGTFKPVEAMLGDPPSIQFASLPKSAPGLPSLGPSASGRLSLASSPSGVGRASLDMAGAMMGTPRSKGLTYAPSLPSVPREAVQALSLQDLPKMQAPSRSNISQSGNLPSAPLGNVERSSLPDLPQKDARQAMADFDRSFRMGPVSPPKAYGQARASAGVPASARASASLPSGFKAPSISPRMAEVQSMAALDAIPNAPIDLVGDMQPAFGKPKAPDVQPVDLPQIGAKPQAVAAPNPYGTMSVPKRMMDPTAPNLIPNTKLPNAPNPVGVKGAQALSKMALTGLGGVIGGMPGALVGRLAAKALEDRVGDAAGDFFTGGVIGPSGHSYAPGSSVQRGVEAMQGGNVGDFWNHNSDLDPAAGLAYSRERAALEGRPAPKSLFEKMGEDLSKATGGGSSSGGGTIICSELHEQGYMPTHIWKADEEWGRMIARKDPDIIRGYRYWAAPVVRLMQSSKRATKIIAWLTKPWAYQMAYEVGAVEKGSFLGYCTNAIGIPLSWTVGKALKLRKKWRVKYGWA